VVSPFDDPLPSITFGGGATIRPIADVFAACALFCGLGFSITLDVSFKLCFLGAVVARSGAGTIVVDA
jgi:hypothetical protein